MDTVDICVNQAGSRSDIAVIQVRGSLDTVAAYRFQEQLHTFMQRGMYKYIIDLRELDYISSAGIGVFPGIAPELKRHQGGLVFINVTEKIYKLFTMIGLTTIFGVKETLEAAIEEFEADG